jgi:hypothetical protein
MLEPIGTTNRHEFRFWHVKEPIQLGIQVLQPPKFGNFTNYRDILRPYEIGIGAYSTNSNFIWPQNVPVISKISKFGGLEHLNPKLYGLLDVARIYS